jgi:tellurite methyltransferase
MKEFKWEDFYKITKDRPHWPLLAQAVSLLTHRKYALDLGCGAGRDTRYLLDQGFYVTAVDSNLHAIALLADFPQDRLRAVQSSFETFEFETYDLINAHFALPFTPKERFHQVFARVKQALNPGGIFVGQFFGVNDEWNTPENHMTFFTMEQAEDELKGLKVVEFREEDVDSHVADGSPKHWHVFHIIAQNESNGVRAASVRLS